MTFSPGKAEKSFCREYGDWQVRVSSPGRANIIGEHIDYCGGTVMPFAIQEHMVFWAAKSLRKTSIIASMEDGWHFDPFKVSGSHRNHRYFIACLAAMENQGYKPGFFSLGFTSSIPRGGGLSSSTALCCGFIASLSALFDFDLSFEELINLASQAEYGAGTKGGLMDQYSIVCGKRDKALYLDCETRSYSLLDLNPQDFSFILWDTGVSHSLANSDYNLRRRQLDEARERIEMHKGREQSFAEMQEEDLQHLEDRTYRRRLRHVIEEMARARKAKYAICAKQPGILGELMNDSHRSLRDNFEVSCPEADYLVSELNGRNMCHGARIMGGGFGGHVIALMKSYDVEKQSDLSADYFRRWGLHTTVRTVKASPGLFIETA